MSLVRRARAASDAILWRTGIAWLLVGVGLALLLPASAAAYQVGTVTVRGYGGVEEATYTSADSTVYGAIGSTNGQPTVFVSVYQPSTGARVQAYLIPDGPVEVGTYIAAGGFSYRPGLYVIAGPWTCDNGGTFTIHSLDLGNWWGDGFEVSWTQNCGSGPLSGHALIEAVMPPDTIPPVLQLPGDGYIGAEALAGADGTIVNFTVTATDDRDPNPVVVCEPQSGSWFPLGGTDIQCTATDNAGNSTSGTLHLWVFGPDITPPYFYWYPDFDVPATSPSGAVVWLYVLAADDRGQPTVTCSTSPDNAPIDPVSYHEFPINPVGESTLVTCIATDQAGNSATASFTVHVQGASEQVGGLIDMINGYELDKLGTSLTDKLTTVQRLLDKGKSNQALENLDAFVNEVRAQDGRGLQDWQVWQITWTVDQIKPVIGYQQ